MSPVPEQTSAAYRQRWSRVSSRAAARLNNWLLFVALSALFGAGYVALVQSPAPAMLLKGMGYGAVIGGSLGAFQIFYMEGDGGRRIRRAPFTLSLVVRTGIAAVIIALALILCRLLFEDGAAGSERFSSGLFLRDAAFSFFAFLVIFFFGQMRRIIGPRVLRNFILGRYYRPVREDRVFLFLDLVGSTALTGRLGSLGVHALISRVFFDMDAVIVEHGGEVHRYVGDEVVVTWPLEECRRDARCLRCVAAIDRMIAERADAYRSAFGTVPAFRAGLHGGPVVAGECGDSKQEIVYFGDTINMAARLQDECRRHQVSLLISGELMRLLPVPADMPFQALGSVRLRGRETETELFTVRQPTAEVA